MSEDTPKVPFFLPALVALACFIGFGTVYFFHGHHEAVVWKEWQRGRAPASAEERVQVANRIFMSIGKAIRLRRFKLECGVKGSERMCWFWAGAQDKSGEWKYSAPSMGMGKELGNVLNELGAQLAELAGGEDQAEDLKPLVAQGGGVFKKLVDGKKSKNIRFSMGKLLFQMGSDYEHVGADLQKFFDDINKFQDEQFEKLLD